jgi:acetyl esterase/lipase
MKRNAPFPMLRNAFCILLFAICFAAHPLSISAQSALGCNGTRYLADVFTDTTTTTIQYGANAVSGVTQQLKMDIVEPKTDTLKLRPLIIWAFGGGFVQGQRKEMLPFCVTYAKKGYVNAAIDYRLYSLAGGWPDSVKITHTIIQAVQDMKASIRYFKKSAKLDNNPYRIDTNNIIVGGVSAGAITAMATAQMDSLDPIEPWIRTIIAQEGGFEGGSGTPGYSTNVKGAISMSGALSRKEWLDKNDVPFASFHGTADNVVAYGYGPNVYSFYGDGSGTLHPRAVELGIPSVLVTVPGGGHTDIYAHPTFAPIWFAKMTEFMRRLICGLTPLSAEEIGNQQVKIYPNPANDDMTVEIDKNTDGTSRYNREGGKFELSVFDALGRSVFSLKNQTNNPIVLHKKDIGTGMFFVRMNFENSAKSILKKIVFE